VKFLETVYNENSFQEFSKKVVKDLKGFKESISLFEKKIETKGKINLSYLFLILGLYCHYWNEKVSFMNSQVEIIDSTLNKIVSLIDLFKYLADLLKGTLVNSLKKN
jgi:hypothetical protein